MGATSTLMSPLADAIRLTPVRPAIAAGLRAATATVAPLVVGYALDRHELAWSALAGFLAAILDKGGAYAARARTLVGFSLAAAVLAPLAAVIGDAPAAMLPALFASATALGYLRVYGGTAGSVGAVLLILVVVSLAQPTSWDAALERGAWVLAGGGWATALSLLMWPVRPYRPARAAAARVLRTIAAYARGPAASEEDPAAWSRTQRAAIRQALEDARVTLAATRRGRRGDTGRGARLLALLETSDRLFAASVTLAEHATEGAGRAHSVLDEVAALAAAAASMVESEREAPQAEATTVPLPADAVERMFERPRRLGHEVFELAMSIEDERPVPVSLALSREPQPLLGPLRDNWTLRSSLLRHALRAGVATTVAALLASVAELQRGQWVTVAVAVILQPQLPATFLRATQRVLGTVVGALLAALFTGAIDAPWGMLPVMFVFAAIGVAVQPLSYALYSTFLTPTFVLLAEASTHDPSLVTTRIVNTLIGGAIALLAARFLWPISERDLFPDSARAALLAARDHLRVVTQDDRPTTRTNARREVGLALLNAETSLNRWLAEVRRRAVTLEAPIALVAHVRHLSAATLALGELTTPAMCAQGTPFFEAVDAVLSELAGLTDDDAKPQATPSELPALDTLVVGPEVQRAAMTRVAEALSAVHAAATRWHAMPARAA